MDTLLSNRALGYLSIALFIVAAFFALLELFTAAAAVAVISVLAVFGLWRLRVVLESRRHYGS